MDALGPLFIYLWLVMSQTRNLVVSTTSTFQLFCRLLSLCVDDLGHKKLAKWVVRPAFAISHWIRIIWSRFWMSIYILENPWHFLIQKQPSNLKMYPFSSTSFCSLHNGFRVTQDHFHHFRCLFCSLHNGLIIFIDYPLQSAKSWMEFLVLFLQVREIMSMMSFA